jgi:ribonucleoside-diphosphate reductase alpha chain
VCQKYVDHSISSTVNLPEDIEPEVISQIYLQAWKSGLKGITIYRDGSRYPILSVEGHETPFQRAKTSRYVIRIPERESSNGGGTTTKEYEVGGDEVLRLSNGRLTTVYHYLRQQERESGDLEAVPAAQVVKN